MNLNDNGDDDEEQEGDANGRQPVAFAFGAAHAWERFTVGAMHLSAACCDHALFSTVL